MLKKIWPYVMVAVLLVAAIDHGTKAIKEPTAMQVALTSIYLIGLVGGIAWIFSTPKS